LAKLSRLLAIEARKFEEKTLLTSGASGVSRVISSKSSRTSINPEQNYRKYCKLILLSLGFKCR
jgi:hypothetical protein